MSAGGLRHDGDEANFVIVPRPTVRDEELSLRALGLLTRLLDLPPGWDVNAKRLERMVKEGREAIYTALRELRAAGYYRIERRRAEGGRWVTGTAVAKTARPEWAAEYAEQEAARQAGRDEPVPTWEPTPDPDDDDPAPITDGDEADTPTEVREPVSRSTEVREPVAREPVAREPVAPKEEPPRRTAHGTGDSGGAPSVSRGAGEQPPTPRPALDGTAPPAAPAGDDPEPPTRCPVPHGPETPCRGCGDARRSHQAWEDREAARRRHRAEVERAADEEARRLTRAEIAACRLCDTDGLVSSDAGGRVRCTHDPSTTTGQGRATWLAAKAAERDRYSRRHHVA